MRTKATLIYDGQCGFCRRWIERVRRWDRHGRIAVLPYQSPELAVRFPELSPEACALRIHVVEEDGTVHAGAAAGREVLRRLPGGSLWAVPFAIPGVLAVAERLYVYITKRWGPVRDASFTG